LKSKKDELNQDKNQQQQQRKVQTSFEPNKSQPRFTQSPYCDSEYSNWLREQNEIAVILFFLMRT
jgi:hypothetical protein